ncbi:MAG: ParB/RepB/Spo0J family partition protein [Trichlorobacter sp.]|uniref:ParB/RepB/Spo0J family partition protein n=1 Tax=Trichlorobacter sp. TaxID=2911007 RepID=UPI002562DEEF|nr:ParB/RepB/Spo0J family partition protein [Trichlorobacter sp.]MDK9717357.1 ParB/RepB/Spo0J family partition protein [Trichlorobacter sp.]
MATSSQTTYEKGRLYNLAIGDLQPDPDQPRKYFDEQALVELKASIEKHGVLQPVLVRQSADGSLLLVSGERRYQASLLAGCETIPAVFTDGEPAEISIVENLLRENLTAIEEAEAIESLRAQHDYALNDLVTILGKSDSAISAILSLNRLPAEVKDDCRTDPKTARSILVEIAKLKTTEKMTATYTRYKESGLTRGEIRKQTAKQKPADAPIDLTFVDQFYSRMYLLDAATLTTEQKAALYQELVKLRSMAYQKMKHLK